MCVWDLHGRGICAALMFAEKLFFKALWGVIHFETPFYECDHIGIFFKGLFCKFEFCLFLKNSYNGHSMDSLMY